MTRIISTDKAPPPFSRYAQAVSVPAGHRLIAVSGQVGVDLDGNLATTEKGQHEQTWRNILAILVSEGLGPSDIVEVTAYLTTQSGVPVYREVRDRMLDGATPASTLLIISGLADPAWLVEIAVLAAAPE
jgi:enamine deaminase RidA (YjgF/YER057c/UK114 family)